MMSTDHLFAFFLATAVFAYMPGPALLYTAAQTLSHGREAGWMTALGLHIGGYVHVIAAALGLSVLFTAVPALYSIVKVIGAAYLIWLGVQLFISTTLNLNEATDADKPSSRRAFWQSITVEILNPKTAIFYIAFLPQFIDPAGTLPIWGQLVILGTIVNIMFSSADALCVMLSSSVVEQFKTSPKGVHIAQRIGGSVLIGLGVNLALSRH